MYLLNFGILLYLIFLAYFLYEIITALAKTTNKRYSLQGQFEITKQENCVL